MTILEGAPLNQRGFVKPGLAVVLLNDQSELDPLHSGASLLGGSKIWLACWSPAKSWVWGMGKLIYIYISKKSNEITCGSWSAQNKKTLVPVLIVPIVPFLPVIASRSSFNPTSLGKCRGDLKGSSWIHGCLVRKKKTWQDVCRLSILGLFNTCGSQLHPWQWSKAKSSGGANWKTSGLTREMGFWWAHGRTQRTLYVFLCQEKNGLNNVKHPKI